MALLRDVHTLCDLLLLSGGGPRCRGPVTSTALETLVRSYGRGFAEQGYPAGALVLLAIRDPGELLAVSFGAWWAGHVVSFAPPEDHARRDRLAVALGAALQVCDPPDIVDEEHLRHRDVPAVPPHQLALPPASWHPRCRPDSIAITEPELSHSHSDLLGLAYERCATRSVAPTYPAMMAIAVELLADAGRRGGASAVAREEACA